MAESSRTGTSERGPYKNESCGNCSLRTIPTARLPRCGWRSCRYGGGVITCFAMIELRQRRNRIELWFRHDEKCVLFTALARTRKHVQPMETMTRMCKHERLQVSLRFSNGTGNHLMQRVCLVFGSFLDRPIRVHSHCGPVRGRNIVVHELSTLR